MNTYVQFWQYIIPLGFEVALYVLQWSGLGFSK